MSSDWAASALKWWSDAGVDTLVGEEPRDWLRPAPKAPPEPLRPAAEALPADLAGLQAWLVASDRLPFAAPSAPRAGPAGDPAAGLMVMVDMPAAAGVLIGGEAGVLFDRMLGAIGRDRDSIYLASLSPVRPATGRIDAASEQALAAIARHHIGLVRPAALLLFGDSCARALLGDTVPATRGRWHEIDTPAGKIKTLATIRPEKLLQVPSLKKHAWDDLQRLMEGLKQ